MVSIAAHLLQDVLLATRNQGHKGKEPAAQKSSKQGQKHTRL
jgi:hypothetical protein